MKVTKELAVNVDELYVFMRELVYEDMKANHKKDLTLKDIQEKMRYKKKLTNKMGKQDTACVTIDALNKEKYCAIFETAHGKNIITYLFTPLNDEYTKVTYEELYEGINTSTSLSYSILSFLTARSHKKRMASMLYQIEEHIITERQIANE